MRYPLILPTTEFDAVILADGEMPHHPTPLGIMAHAQHLVCCDGAARHCPRRPEAIVGDGDSLTAEERAAYADIYHQVDEQEDNDLTKATRYCLSRGWRHIAYLGATGKREDHTLGNISLIMRYFAEMGLRPTMVTDYGAFTPARGTSTFDTFPRQQISIYNCGCQQLGGEGFRWQVYPYRSMWQGTLNEAVAHQVTLNGDDAYLVFRTFKPKTTSTASQDEY